MSESTHSNLLLLDATAKFRPDKVDHAGGVNMEDIAWDTPEDRENFWGTAKGMYEDLAKVAESSFSVAMPDFNQEMFELVSFNGVSRASTKADHDPASGLIRISTAHNITWLDLMKSMAHEIAHFAAIRKIFTDGNSEVPGRVGVSVIGNRVASRDGKTPFEFHQYRGDVFNEALTEIISAEMVSQLKDKYDFVPEEGVQPEAYHSERRLYSALVEAIAYSWNNSEFREGTIIEREFWKEPDHGLQENIDRVSVIKQRLGWQDQIDIKQVDKVFRDALTAGDGLTKISYLINTCLGNNAFQKLWDEKPGESNDKAWHIIRPFSLARAYKRENMDLDFNGLTVHVDGNNPADNIIFQTYEERDGTKLGIQEIFTQYERLVTTPLPKEHLELYAEKINQRRIASNSEYPFDLPVVHEESRSSIFLKTGKPTLDYCFRKLTEALGVNTTKPIEIKTTTEILGTIYRTEYFECKNKPELLLVKVETADTANETSNIRYFFVKQS